jgi:hypothetical protein
VWVCGEIDITTYLNSGGMNSKLESKISRLDLKVSKELKLKLTSGHEITLDKSYYVEAQMKNSERWFRARILDCKLSKGNNVSSRNTLELF